MVCWRHLCLWALIGVGWQEGAGAVTYSNNRIAIDADGNYNDTDDWGPALRAGVARQARPAIKARALQLGEHHRAQRSNLLQ